MAKFPLAVFRCAAPECAGWGHIRRCQALADALTLAGWRCQFAIGGETPDALQDQWNDGTDLLVTDDYGVGADFESACRPWANRILAVDDLADRTHDADWLVDHNAGRDATDYSGLVPESCTVFCGPGYALLSREFHRRRETGVPRKTRNRGPYLIFINFGGGIDNDASGFLQNVLDALEALEQKLHVTVVVGSKDLAAALSAPSRDVRANIGAEDMASLVAASDIVIGAGGVSLLERCCVGTPSIVLTVAENQQRGTAVMAESGACIDLGRAEDACPETIGSALSALLEAPADRKIMSATAAGLTDGLGSLRIAAALTTQKNEHHIYLRRATRDYELRLLDWQRDPETRKFARNPQVPDPYLHKSWFHNRLARGDCIFNIVMSRGDAVGLLRLDRISGEREGYEVSISTAPGLKGRGIGKAALLQARGLAAPEKIWAWVHEDNAASHALFQSAGYSAAANGWYARDTRVAE